MATGTSRDLIVTHGRSRVVTKLFNVVTGVMFLCLWIILKKESYEWLCGDHLTVYGKSQQGCVSVCVCVCVCERESVGVCDCVCVCICVCLSKIF